MSESSSENEERRLELTSRIVAAYLSRNAVPAADLPNLIERTYSSLSSTSQPDKAETVVVERRPAIPIKKSVTPEFIVCLEDGRKFKSLRRHLMAKYGLTPEQYRAKWDLPADYPMIAPDYARRRSALARAAGLGKKRRAPS
ncbi:MucR family transcriptional regulator [Sinorhizobium prairiense]|uniref:MucR family transcriptional regulator n=1 Tax=unclassified Sinorhizobium TaxID=2613772 RepID=UPI0023D8BAE4|nr:MULTISPECIES: MucR family transcriptional regulator [unclassified Sinorhizobium]WEJ13818.1 MucR family transcriptional regulator [Sinorhizobium sp. K101]WEJ35418.1 MucR family transcriptional regulator [Sinorhizobium sp. C101]